MMKVMSSVLGLLLVVSVPCLSADEQMMSLPVQDAGAAEPVVEEDQGAALRELCEGYADEDNIAEDQREAHIEDCMSSMTDITAQDAQMIGQQEALPVVQEAVHPEELIADELVESPPPGVEELVPAGVETVEQAQMQEQKKPEN